MPGVARARRPGTRRAKPVVLAGIGVLAGVLSGLFGVGGGAVIVPALVSWCGRDQRQAVATSLLALAPLAISGAVGFWVRGQVDAVVAVPLAAGSLLGALVAAGMLNRAPQATLRWIFAVVALATAAKLVTEPGAVSVGVSHQVWRLLLMIPVGSLIGLIAGLTGTGGGALMVPLMQLALNASAALAKGTSLLVILPTSVFGSWRNLRYGNGSVPDALWIGLPGMLGAILASQVSVAMNPVLSNVLFGAFLVFIAVNTVWRDLKSLLRGRSR
jgi:uncharacterized protein